MDEITALPTWMIATLVVFVIVQVGLEVYAIIDIIRRPADRITGNNKVLWVLLVLFVNLIGAIIYLVVGRKPDVVTDARPVDTAPEVASNAVDTLYGEGGSR